MPYKKKLLTINDKMKEVASRVLRIFHVWYRSEHKPI